MREVQTEQPRVRESADAPPRVNGEMTAAISNAIVRVFAEWIGRGPTRARTVMTDNVVTTILQDTLTKAERRLVEEGGLDAVMQMRRTHQGMMRGAVMDAVEEITGRKVVAFLSDHQAEPDYATEVFVLAEDEDAPEAPRAAAPTGIVKEVPPSVDSLDTSREAQPD